ncbi:hypothetical protein [Ideonella sp. A 288]|uniref:hypothetical protein n=1 Tax=Ideonella sp. A 288 TaxID=1962181 RepID=UPI000B4AB777|nr:hypothetical protein [Ideonella sp. A 288]
MSLLLSAPESQPPTVDPAVLAEPLLDLRRLVSGLSAEVALRLTRALAHLGTLADQEHSDGRLIQSLGDEIDGARRIGMLGQQIARLASGHVRPETEHVVVSDLLSAQLDQRRLSLRSGAALHASIAHTSAQGDASLISALLHAAVDWAEELAESSIDLVLSPSAADQGPELSMSFNLAAPVSPLSTDTLQWHLLYFTAEALGIRPQRRRHGNTLSLSLRLPRAGNSHSLPRVDDPIDGCQVLVVAPEREIRNKVRLAIRGLDLLVDYVASVDAAARYCQDSLPEAVVYDGRLDGPRLNELRSSLDADRRLPFIEICGHVRDNAAAQHEGTTHIHLDALMDRLPSTLATELARMR